VYEKVLGFEISMANTSSMAVTQSLKNLFEVVSRKRLIKSSRNINKIKEFSSFG